MDQKEKRALETQLMKMGLAGLDSRGNPTNDLIDQLASLVNCWQGMENRHGEWVDKHVFFRDLLNECDADKRSAMYDAIVPRLNWKALPLATYEAQIQLKASALVSQRKMRVVGDAQKIVIGGNEYALTSKARATGVVATVSCWKCPKRATFHADTAAGAMIEARKAGWTRDKALNKETCPECAVVVAAEEQVVLDRNRTLIVTDRRSVN
jgi:hypothetical protein